MQTSPSPSDDAVDLREYAAVLRRRIWLIAGVTVLLTGMAVAYSFTRVPMYTAQTTVLVQAVSGSTQYRPDQLVSLDTEARLAKSAPVAALAIDALGSPLTIQQFLQRVAVEITPDTLVLDIFFSDGSAPRAADGADAVAQAYLQFKRQQAVDAAAVERESIQDQIDLLVGQRDKLDAKLDDALPGTTNFQDIQRERDAITSTVGILTAELAGVAPSLSPGRVILPATPPQAPSSPRHPLNLAMGLLLGAFIGVLLAFVRDRTDERITGRTDLDVTLDAPVLAAIPRVAGWSKKGAVWLVTEQQPRSPAAEAYRTLRTGVMAMARQRDLKVFGIASSMQGEGKTTTAANLAAALAHADKRVLAISADLRRPTLHRYYKLGNDVGLVEVLQGELALEQAVLQAAPNLTVLVSGRPSSRPAELLQSHRMAELIERQRERFDFVIVDCPPVIGLSDTLAIAPFVDAMILVAAADVSKRGAIIHAVDQLGQVGATVRAGVLNNVSHSKRNGTYGYGYGGVQPEDEADSSARRRPGNRRPTAVTAPGNGKTAPRAEDLEAAAPTDDVADEHALQPHATPERAAARLARRDP